MKEDQIRTSYDLADYLEATARALRILPCVELSEVRASSVRRTGNRQQRKDRQTNELDSNLASFATRLTEISKEAARDRLSELSIDSIRQLASVFEIRVPSKGTKAEFVDLLIAQLFDAPSGQELIRTFHKRHGFSSREGQKTSPWERQQPTVGKLRGKAEVHPREEGS